MSEKHEPSSQKALDKWERWWEQLLQREVTRRQALGGAVELGASALTWRTLQRLIPSWALPGLLERIRTSTGKPDSASPTLVEPPSLPPIEQAEYIQSPEPSLYQKIRTIEEVWDKRGFEQLLADAKASVEVFGMIDNKDDPLGNYWGVINYFSLVKDIIEQNHSTEGESSTQMLFLLGAENLFVLENIIYPQFRMLGMGQDENSIALAFQQERVGRYSRDYKRGQHLKNMRDAQREFVYPPDWYMNGDSQDFQPWYIPKAKTTPWVLSLWLNEVKELEKYFPGIGATLEYAESSIEIPTAMGFGASTLTVNARYGMWQILRGGGGLHEVYGHAHPIDGLDISADSYGITYDTVSPERLSFWDPRTVLTAFTEQNRVIAGLLEGHKLDRFPETMAEDPWGDDLFSPKFRSYLKTLDGQQRRHAIRNMKGSENLAQEHDSEFAKTLLEDISSGLIEGVAQEADKGELARQAFAQLHSFFLEIAHAQGDGLAQLIIIREWLEEYPDSTALKYKAKEVFDSVQHFLIDPYLSYCQLSCINPEDKAPTYTLLPISMDPLTDASYNMFAKRAAVFAPNGQRPPHPIEIGRILQQVQQETDVRIVQAIQSLPGSSGFERSQLRDTLGEPTLEAQVLAELARISIENPDPWEAVVEEKDKTRLKEIFLDKSDAIFKMMQERKPQLGAYAHLLLHSASEVYSSSEESGEYEEDTRFHTPSILASWQYVLRELLSDPGNVMESPIREEIVSRLHELDNIVFVINRLLKSNLGGDRVTSKAIHDALSHAHRMVLPFLLSYDPGSHNWESSIYRDVKRIVSNTPIEETSVPFGFDRIANLRDDVRLAVETAYTDEEIALISQKLYLVETLYRKVQMTEKNSEKVSGTALVLEELQNTLKLIERATPNAGQSSNPVSRYLRTMNGFYRKLSIDISSQHNPIAVAIMDGDPDEVFANVIHRIRAALAGWYDTDDPIFGEESEPQAFGTG